MAHTKLNVRRWLAGVMCLVMGIGQPFPVAAGDAIRAVNRMNVVNVASNNVVLGFALSSDPPFNPIRPALIAQGDFITYTLSISNPSALTVTLLVITNVVPLGATSVVSSWMPTPQYTSPLVWQIDALAPGATMTMQHVLRVNDNVTVTAIVNTAVLTSSDLSALMTRTTVHPFGVTSAPQVVIYLPLMRIDAR